MLLKCTQFKTYDNDSGLLYITVILRVPQVHCFVNLMLMYPICNSVFLIHITLQRSIHSLIHSFINQIPLKVHYKNHKIHPTLNYIIVSDSFCIPYEWELFGFIWCLWSHFQINSLWIIHTLAKAVHSALLLSLMMQGGISTMHTSSQFEMLM